MVRMRPARPAACSCDRLCESKPQDSRGRPETEKRFRLRLSLLPAGWDPAAAGGRLITACQHGIPRLTTYKRALFAAALMGTLHSAQVARVRLILRRCMSYDNDTRLRLTADGQRAGRGRTRSRRRTGVGLPASGGSARLLRYISSDLDSSPTCPATRHTFNKVILVYRWTDSIESFGRLSILRSAFRRFLKACRC